MRLHGKTILYYRVYPNEEVADILVDLVQVAPRGRAELLILSFILETYHCRKRSRQFHFRG
jgi:hypothetical protein